MQPDNCLDAFIGFLTFVFSPLNYLLKAQQTSTAVAIFAAIFAFLAYLAVRPRKLDLILENICFDGDVAPFTPKDSPDKSHQTYRVYFTLWNKTSYTLRPKLAIKIPASLLHYRSVNKSNALQSPWRNHWTDRLEREDNEVILKRLDGEGYELECRTSLHRFDKELMEQDAPDNHRYIYLELPFLAPDMPFCFWLRLRVEDAEPKKSNEITIYYSVPYFQREYSKTIGPIHITTNLSVCESSSRC